MSTTPPGLDSQRDSLRQRLGGTLRPGDSRRFLIEVMVGAMHADGQVDDREQETLRRILAHHDLFSALRDDVAEMLIELSTDAVLFAGSAVRRIDAIAANLRWRHERLAAYAMACEVCASDDHLADSERDYLAALRQALRVDVREHEQLTFAAKNGRAMAWLEATTVRLRELTGPLLELLVLRARDAGRDASAMGEAAAYLASVRDLAPTEEAVAAEVARVARQVPSWGSTDEELARIGAELPDHNDRYWVTVYVMGWEALRGRTEWRELDYFALLGRHLGLDEASLSDAFNDATLLCGAVAERSGSGQA